MLPHLHSETMTSKILSQHPSPVPQEELLLPVPSKPLLIGLIYLALRIRKSWILPSDIIRWICDGKIPYVTLFNLLSDKQRQNFHLFTHCHRVFNRDNLLSSSSPLSVMNLIFHSSLLSQLLDIPYPSLNGPLQCYAMILSLGLPYQTIWPILVKLTHLYSSSRPLDECQLRGQAHHDYVALTVFTACQLSPCWLTNWSYEPYQLSKQQRPQSASEIVDSSTLKYGQTIEEPPHLARAIAKARAAERARAIAITTSQRYEDHTSSSFSSSSLLDPIHRHSFQTRPQFPSELSPVQDRTFLPKSVSESDHVVTRANLVDILSHLQNTMRQIDHTTRLAGVYDNAGFLSFNKTLKKVLEQITPSGCSFLESLLFNPSPSNSSSSSSSFSTSSVLSRPRYDSSMYSSGATILPGNPITFSSLTVDEAYALKRTYAHSSLFTKLQKKKFKEFYTYITYQTSPHSDPSVGVFHPPYQLLLERLSRHMFVSCEHIYSLQQHLDQKLLLITQNIHQNYQRRVAAKLRLKRSEINQLSRSAPMTSRRITEENIEEYAKYCKYVFPMLQKFSSWNEFDDHEKREKGSGPLGSNTSGRRGGQEKKDDADDAEETPEEGEDEWDDVEVIYSRGGDDRDPYRNAKLKSNFSKESSHRALWDSQSIYDTMNRMMTRQDEDGKRADVNPGEDEDDEGLLDDCTGLEGDDGDVVDSLSQPPVRRKGRLSEEENDQKKGKKRRRGFKFKDGGVPIAPMPFDLYQSEVDDRDDEQGPRGFRSSVWRRMGLELEEEQDEREAMVFPDLHVLEGFTHSSQRRLTRSERSLRDQQFHGEDLYRGKYEFMPGVREQMSDGDSDEDYLPGLSSGGEEIDHVTDQQAPIKRRRELSRFMIEKRETRRGGYRRRRVEVEISSHDDEEEGDGGEEEEGQLESELEIPNSHMSTTSVIFNDLKDYIEL
jgi:hypothetical protein